MQLYSCSVHPFFSNKQLPQIGSDASKYKGGNSKYQTFLLNMFGAKFEFSLYFYLLLQSTNLYFPSLIWSWKFFDPPFHTVDHEIENKKKQ